MDIIHEKMKPGEFSPGIYDCYSNRQYHEHEGLSKSNLDQLHRTPAHYRASIAAKGEETPAQRFGTAFHCAALEPVMFSAGYTVIPGDKRTKAVKDAWAEAEKSGKIVLTMEEFDAINGMCAALWSSKNAEVFLRPALREHSVFAELNGVRVKCRPDAWNVGYNVILDLKTTEDASPRAFAASCRKWRYYVQDAYYRHVVAAAIGADADSDLSFVFVAVEKKPPFGVAWYTLDGNDAALGWAEALGDMQIYKNAMESGNWPGYSAKIETLSIFSRRADV